MDHDEIIVIKGKGNKKNKYFNEIINNLNIFLLPDRDAIPELKIVFLLIRYIANLSLFTCDILNKVHINNCKKFIIMSKHSSTRKTNKQGRVNNFHLIFGHYQTELSIIFSKLLIVWRLA